MAARMVNMAAPCGAVRKGSGSGSGPGSVPAQLSRPLRRPRGPREIPKNKIPKNSRSRSSRSRPGAMELEERDQRISKLTSDLGESNAKLTQLSAESRRLTALLGTPQLALISR
ncbi:uncharacterized protein M8220_015076 [Acridotheres tristis]